MGESRPAAAGADDIGVVFGAALTRCGPALMLGGVSGVLAKRQQAIDSAASDPVR